MNNAPSSHALHALIAAARAVQTPDLDRKASLLGELGCDLLRVVGLRATLAACQKGVVRATATLYDEMAFRSLAADLLAVVRDLAAISAVLAARADLQDRPEILEYYKTTRASFEAALQAIEQVV